MSPYLTCLVSFWDDKYAWIFKGKYSVNLVQVLDEWRLATYWEKEEDFKTFIERLGMLPLPKWGDYDRAQCYVGGVSLTAYYLPPDPEEDGNDVVDMSRPSEVKTATDADRDIVRNLGFVIP